MSSGTKLAPIEGLPGQAGALLTPEIVTALAYEAAERIEDIAQETPVIESNVLSTPDTSVRFKDESAQPGGSFKIRGATNGVAYHADNGAELVVTSTAGSHGIGMAMAARKYGLAATAVVSTTASQEKKNSIRRQGAEVVEYGQNFDEALAYGLGLAKARGGQFVHPFANELVIAGQATVGLELLEQEPDMTHLVLPVGGGGLLTGVASVIKQHKENVKVIAAQVEGNTAFVDSWQSTRALQGQSVNRLFEGIAVGNIDPLTFNLAQLVIDDIMVLEGCEVDRTIYELRNEHSTLFERAGAVGPTAARVLAKTALKENARIVTVATGANPPKALWPFLQARARLEAWDERRGQI